MVNDGTGGLTHSQESCGNPSQPARFVSKPSNDYDCFRMKPINCGSPPSRNRIFFLTKSLKSSISQRPQSSQIKVSLWKTPRIIHSEFVHHLLDCGHVCFLAFMISKKIFIILKIMVVISKQYLESGKSWGCWQMVP